ncbi:MAG: hypothetical protein HY815_30940 [Candidatus Riflebacteria bacterium]|nr:hypothetical protein [Candidatus Riflebacteria bacterium]
MKAIRTIWISSVLALVLISTTGAVAGGTVIVVPDFAEHGRQLGLGAPAADLMARSLQAAGRFDVRRTVDRTVPPDALRVEGEIFNVAVLANRQLGWRNSLYPQSFYRNVTMGPGLEFGASSYTLSLDGSVRIVDAKGRVVAQHQLAGEALTLDPWIEPYERSARSKGWGALWTELLESAISDPKEGVVKALVGAIR